MLVCRTAVKKRWNPDQGHHQVLGGHHHQEYYIKADQGKTEITPIASRY